MNSLQKIVGYTLLGFAGLGAAQGDCSDNPNDTAVPTRYISGTIKSEKYQKNMINNDEYFFTLSTEEGLMLFECSSGLNAQRMDLLLDPKDVVKFKIPEWQRDKKNGFSVNLGDIVEINGESVK